MSTQTIPLETEPRLAESPPQPAEAHTRPSRRRTMVSATVGASVLVVAGSLALRSPGFVHQLFDPDEAAIATMGMVVSHGGVIYRDVIDRKPPLAGFVYAAVFRLSGTRDLRLLHVLVALEMAGAALLLAWDVRRRAGRRAGWWAAGLLLAGAVAFRPTDAQAANYSHLAVLPGCAAIVLARRGTTRSAALAGVCLGLAVLTRQTWIIGVVPAAVGAWLHGRRPRRGAVIVTTATALTIGSIGLVVPFGPFLQWTFTGNGSLLFDLSRSGDIVQRGVLALSLFVLTHAAICWLVIRRGWRRDDLDLWLWVAAGLVAFVAGFRFFEHYWLQVLPPLCLLAAPAITAYARAERLMIAAFVAVPTAFAWKTAWSPAVHADPTPLVAEVRRETKPNDEIAVWGSFPEIYWLSGRDPAGGMVLSDFLVGKEASHASGPQTLRDATPGAVDEYLRGLRSHLPVLFLDTSTAHIRGYHQYPITLIPALAELVREHYRPIALVDGVTVYMLDRSAG